MTESVRAVAVTLFLVSHVLLVSATTYYVVPSNNSSLCNETTVHSDDCKTLAYFAENSSDSFSSNTTFIFLHGVHILPHNRSIHVTNKVNMRLIGEKSGVCPVIQCEGDGGFFFENIASLLLHCLTINECGQKMIFPPLNYPHKASLTTKLTVNLNMTEVAIYNSCGYGILAYQVYGKSVLDKCQFVNNSGTDDDDGGNAAIVYTDCGVQSNNTHLKITSSEFVNGSFVQRHNTNFSTGLVIYFYCSGVTVEIVDVIMDGNNVYHGNKDSLKSRGGNLALVYNVTSESHGNIVHVKNCKFINGTAKLGGGVYINYFPSLDSGRKNEVKITDSSFENNTATVDGGAIYFQIDQGITNGFGENVDLQIENCSFTQNSVSSTVPVDAGVAISILNIYISNGSQSHYTQLVAMFKKLRFVQNVLNSSDGFRSSASAIFYIKEQRGQAIIEDCVFENNNASAISAYHSYVIFQGEIEIRNNSAFKGGGLLCEASYVIFSSDLTMVIENNSAAYVGGGIFVEDSCSQPNSLCFYQPTNVSASNNRSIHLIDNTARFAGSQIYGGNIELCYLQVYGDGDRTNHFKEYFNVSKNSSDLSRISSDPIMVCFCEQVDQIYKPNCSITNLLYNEEIYPGEIIYITAAIVGQYNGTVPNVLEISLEEHGEKITINDTNCANMSYTLSTDRLNVSVALRLYRTFNKLIKDNHIKYMHVHTKKCPLGFTTYHSKPNKHCVCEPLLTKNGYTKCFIENQTVLTTPPRWIGYHVCENSTSLTSGFIFHDFCPFDYCKQDNVYIKSSAHDFYEDDQCSYGRTGLLCGSCPPNLSSVVTSSTCTDCSGYSIFVSIMLSIAFGVGGIILVVVLFLCNFTVTEGTMSGLIFYANIFTVNVSILLPDNKYTSLNTFCIIFLSWLNLDPGVPMCFYHGLTEYHKIWGHFVFPVYLWLIAGFIILLCRRYTWAAHLVGRNAVPVLATILLLSYTKINQGIIKSLSYTVVKFPGVNNTVVSVRVWLLDTSIEYLTGKHILLFIAAVIFGVLSLLYTLILLCVRPLQKNSHRRFLKWVNKLKPLIDAYTCPHIIDERKQFWNGLLFLFRLLIICASFQYSTPQFILCVITSSCLILFMMTWSLGGIYKVWQLNLLSSSMLFNLGIISSITLYFLSKSQSMQQYDSTTMINSQVFCSYVSILVVVTTFIVITLFNFYNTLKAMCVFSNALTYIQRYLKRSSAPAYRRLVKVDTVSNSESESGGVSHIVPVFDYREPQLSDYDEN